MMCKEMKKLNKNHLEVVHLDTWESAALITYHRKSRSLNTNLEARLDTLEKQTLSPGDREFLSTGEKTPAHHVLDICFRVMDSQERDYVEVRR
jgi:hypothetical protein